MASIISGLSSMDDMGMDVIILGRGGGSIEDLWAFNDENVARAIFSCRTPVISAVGHETDTTIADYVADMRAPTPSAAAELAVFDYRQYLEDIEAYRISMEKLIYGKLDTYKRRLENFALRLENKNPIRQINDKKQLLDKLKERLKFKMAGRLKEEKARLSVMAERLNSKSPLLRLDKGYAYVSSGENALKSIEQVKAGDTVKIHLKDGLVDTKVTGTSSNGNII